MDRDEAIKALRMCGGCKRWITTKDCDHCWVDRHQCPPTLLRDVPKQIKALERAVHVGEMAAECLQALKAVGLQPSR